MRNTEEMTRHYSLWARLPPIAIMLFLMLVSVSWSVSWANVSCAYSGAISNAPTLAGSLTGTGSYPVAIVNLPTSNTTLYSTDCGNVRFYDSTNTTSLNFTYKNNNATYCRNSTNNMTYFVSLPNQSTGTTFNIYFCPTTTPNGNNPTGVWRGGNYTNVQHMLINSTLTDAAGYTNLPCVGTIDASTSVGFFGDYLRFHGGYCNVTNGAVGLPTGGNVHSVELWLTPNVYSGNSVYYGQDTSNTQNGDEFITTAGCLYPDRDGADVCLPINGNNSFYTYNYDGANDSVRVNITRINSTARTRTMVGNSLFVGARSPAGTVAVQDSNLYEFRYRNASASVDWLTAVSWTGWTLGAIQQHNTLGNISAWNYVQPCYINTTTEEVMTNRPVKCAFNASNILAWNTTTGTNVVFTDSANTTNLSYDLETNSSVFLGNASALTTYYILIPTTINASVGNYTILAHLGNIGVASQENKAGVWGSSGANITACHMGDGTCVLGADGLVSGFTAAGGAISYATTSPTACYSGFCANFSTNSYLVNTTASYPVNGVSYVSVWSYRNNSGCTGASDHDLISYGTTATHLNGVIASESTLFWTDENTFASGISGGCGHSYLEYYAASMHALNNWTLQVNSTTSNGTSSIGAPSTGGSIFIGNGSVGSTWFQTPDTGTIDEFRISTQPRSAGWMQTDYGQTYLIGNMTIVNNGNPQNLTIVAYTDNATSHQFNVSAYADDPDGGSDITSWFLSPSAGSCVNVSNSVAGNRHNFNFSCTATNPATPTLTFNVSDTGGLTNQTTGSHAYPDHAASLTNPTISGSPNVGQTLTCNTGVFSDLDTDTENVSARVWQWFNLTAPIVGQNAQTFVIPAGWGGTQIKCSVNSTNSTWGTSNATANSSLITITSITITLISPNAVDYPLNTTSIPMLFNCSGDAPNYLANLTIDGVLNATGIGATSNATTTYTLPVSISEFGAYNWSVMCYNTTASANSTNLTFFIRNFAPNITTLNISTNGTVYLLGPLYFNITATHNDLAPIYVNYSWLLNGVNQTALNGQMAIPNNSLVQINYTGAYPLVEGDMWSVIVYATDLANATAENFTTNTTVFNYTTNISVNYTTPQSDIYSYTHSLYVTMNGAMSVSAILNAEGANYTVAASNTGTLWSFAYSLTPAQVTYPTDVNYTWFFTTTLANSSTITNNTSYLVSVEPGGLVVCNATNYLVAVNFTIQDFATGAAINATYTSNYIGVVNRTQTGANYNYSWCIAPSNGSISVTLYETYAATGYDPLITQRTLIGNNISQNITIYLLNTSAAYPTTLSLQRLPNIPLSGQTIIVSKYLPPSNYTVIQSCVTGASGTCLVYMIPNSVYYFYNLSGVNMTVGPEVLTCTPGSTTCFRNFFVGAGVAIPSVVIGSTTGSCVYSNITGYVSCSASSTASEVEGFGLVLYQSGASSFTCSNTTIGASATLTCGVPQTNNTIWYYALYTDETSINESITTGSISINIDRTALLGRDSWFIMLFLFVFLAAVGAAHPLLGMAFGIMGLLLGTFVGIVPFNAINAMITITAVMAGAIIYKLRV